jgi:hypothetical protein
MTEEIPLSIEQARHHPDASQKAGANGATEPVPHGTIIRWIYTGVRGVKLETEMRGGRRVIFPSALRRFHQQLSGKPVDMPPTGVQIAQQHRRQARELVRRKRPRGQAVRS